MKRALITAALAAIAQLALAQPATVTVTDTLRLANGNTFCSGSINVSWPTFTSMDGFRIQGGSLPVAVNSSGVFSIALVPTNTNSNPNQGFYSIRYDLRPNLCAPATGTWKVPSSGPVGLSGVESISIPPPPQIPVNSLQSPGIAGTFELCYSGGIVNWGACGGAQIIQGTTRQVKATTSSGTVTLSLPTDLLLSGQSANGTDMLSGSRFTDSTPTGNFINFKSVAGASLWQVDVNGNLLAGTIPFARMSFSAANVVSLFSGCSGTLLLQANGACGSAGVGSVTNVSSGNFSPLFTVGVATSTTTPVFSFSAVSQTQNLFYASPNGSSGSPTFRAIAGADLPNPSGSTLGGIQSFALTSHLWVKAISTAGVPVGGQPDFTDITGTVAAAQLPNPSASTLGGIESFASVSHQFINQISTSGVPTAAQPVFADISGTATAAQIPANVKVRAIGAGFDGAGSALTAGTTSTVYFTAPFACTIAAWNITVDAGTIIFDVWKIASGTAIPTIANTITAAALPTLSSGTAARSTTLTAWTTSVSANDIFGVEINTVATAKKASLILECDQ